MVRLKVIRIIATGALLLSVATLVAEAQQNRKMPHVGILAAGSIHDMIVKEFLEGLQQPGYNEGRNVNITYRVANGRQERLPELAAELVASHIDVIAALGPAT
jgi:putative ABC transport system substrate-binding protein